MAELLTTKEIQALLQVDRTTVYRMVEAQRLPAIKVGKQWRFPADLVEAWLKDRAASPLPDLRPEFGLSSEASDASEARGTGEEIAAYLPLDCAQLIHDAFGEVLGVMLVVTDMDGQPLTRVSNPCPLYHLLALAENGLAVCQEKWREMAKFPVLEPRFEPSLGGLACARALVRVGNELKAMVIVFGVALEGWSPTPERVTELEQVLDVSPDELQSALSSVYNLSPPQQKMALVTIQRIADILAYMGTKYTALTDQLSQVSGPGTT